MYICQSSKKYMVKCELGKVAEMGIFTRRYYPHTDGYRVWEQFETRDAGMGTGLSKK